MSRHAKLLVPSSSKPLGRQAAEVLAILVKAEIITRNEARTLIGLAPIEGWD